MPAFKDDDFVRPTVPGDVPLTRPNNQRFNSLDAAERTGIVLWRPTNLPQGFRFRRVQTVNGNRVTQFYANGLTGLSIVQNDSPMPAIARRFKESGGRGIMLLPRQQHAYVRIEGGTTLFVIGNLPDDDLQKIGDGLKLGGGR